MQHDCLAGQHRPGDALGSFEGGLTSINNIHLIFAMRTCHDCGKVLYKNSEGEVPPCPDCGSTLTDVTIGLYETVSATDRIEIVIPDDSPSILLQAVVDRIGKTSDGDIVIAVLIPWFDIVDLILKDPNSIYQIKPRRWEEIIAAAYDRAGFDEVILTSRSGDLGRDIIAIKKGEMEVRYIEEVKAYSPDNIVKAKEVRALMGVLGPDGASKAFFTTTSDFAPKIRSGEDRFIQYYIDNKRLELINREKLIARLNDIINMKS